MGLIPRAVAAPVKPQTLPGGVGQVPAIGR